MSSEEKLGIQLTLQTDYDTALTKVIEALKTEGFGVLTEIDVKQTLKKKIDVDFRPYKILGACNPPLAYKALSAAPEVGLLLPCNVTVSKEKNGVKIAIIDPIAMLNVVNHPELEKVANEAKTRLERVAALLNTTN